MVHVFQQIIHKIYLLLNTKQHQSYIKLQDKTKFEFYLDQTSYTI